MSMNLSLSMPNLPGMTQDKRAWIYREKDGFKRSSRPNSGVPGTLSRPLSPSFERSKVFDGNQYNEFLNRPSTAMLPSMSSRLLPSTRPKTATSTLIRPASSGLLRATNDGVPIKLPRYVETDRQIARFYAYFLNQRPWEHNGPLGNPTVEQKMFRRMVIHFYIFDGTIEINEPKELNSGVNQGTFLKRGRVVKPDGSEFDITEFMLGKTVTMIGHDFQIYDCDLFTREYFKNELGINLPNKIKPPSLQIEEFGAQHATGLGSPLPTMKSNFFTQSQDYIANKEMMDKTTRFLAYEGQVLRFLCVEVNGFTPPFFPQLERELRSQGEDIDRMSNGHGYIAAGNVKRYALSFYLASTYVDLVVQKRKGEKEALDEPQLILKKGKLPKNWRDAQRGRIVDYYEATDFQCGQVIEVYGRYFLLVSCDQFTYDTYQRMFQIVQHEVPMISPEEEKIVQPIPQLGDGFLPIGSNEDTLATVYGMPKVSKDTLKIQRNQNRLIRCRAALLSNNPIDNAREFLITLFLEDDTIQVFEDNKRNSGIWGGSFLKRGRYMNENPEDQETGFDGPIEPRYFVPQDIYLGNIIALNGNKFQIIEMDNMSLKFCETYPDEFPMSDTFRIVGNMTSKIVDMQLNIRPIIVSYDKKHQGWIDQDTFIMMLDNLSLCDDLNDQELLTLIRRFNEKNQVFYHEMCDLISHVYYQQHNTKMALSNLHSTIVDFNQFQLMARSRTVQWRRTFRKDQHTLRGCVSLAILGKLFQKHGLTLSEQIMMEIYSRYQVSRELATPLLKELKDKGALEDLYDAFDAKVRPKETLNLKLKSQTSSHTNLLVSGKLKRKQSTSVLRKGGLTNNPMDTDVRLDLATILIDYNRLCDDIYICDWVFTGTKF